MGLMPIHEHSSESKEKLDNNLEDVSYFLLVPLESDYIGNINYDSIYKIFDSILFRFVLNVLLPRSLNFNVYSRNFRLSPINPQRLENSVIYMIMYRISKIISDYSLTRFPKKSTQVT